MGSSLGQPTARDARDAGDGQSTVRRVVREQLCVGCGLCASVGAPAITMGVSPPGYNRPRQIGSVSSAVEATIAASCPGVVVAGWQEAPNTHPYWGPYHRVMTGFSADEEVRFKGASGGAVTALALYALHSGLVDRVVHVTANPADPAGNAIVVSSTAAEIVEGAGSRYVASSPLQGIEKLLADGGQFAFVGKPCDVSALRQLAKVDARVDRHVPLMLSFFCAGMPSRRAVGRVLETMQVQADDLSAFRFRGDGWPGKATATTRSGRVVQMSYEDSWGGFLSKEVQFRCKICPDAVGGVADIACADAWYGGESGYPTFEELDGRSLIMSRTDRGEDLLTQAIASGALVSEPLAIEDVELMQPSQARRKRLVRGRAAALRATLRPAPVMTGLLVNEASRRAGVFETARNFLGSVRRSLFRS